MSTWVNDLLSEWRQRFAALAEPDPAHLAEESGEAPTRALDLLRTHVKRSGVLLRLAEVKSAPAAATRRTLYPVGDDAARGAAEEGAADGDSSRFVKRRHCFRPEDAAHRKPGAGPMPIKRWKESPAPSDTRRAAAAFRAAAYGEVEALRADVTRLKETLADILVENHQLKRRLELQSRGQAADPAPVPSSLDSGLDSFGRLG